MAYEATNCAPQRRLPEHNTFRKSMPRHKLKYEEILTQIDETFGVNVKQYGGLFFAPIHSTINDNVQWLYDNDYEKLLECLQATHLSFGPGTCDELRELLEKAKKDSDRRKRASGEKTSKSFAGIPGKYDHHRAPSPIVPALDPSSSFETDQTEIATPSSSQPLRTNKTDVFFGVEQLLRRTALILEPQKPGEHWRVFALSSAHFCTEQLNSSNAPNLLQAPFAVRWECFRAAQACQIPLSDFNTLTPSTWANYTRLRNTMKSMARTQPEVKSLPSPIGAKAWNAAMETDQAFNANFSASARITFSHSKTATEPFELILSPLQHLADGATRRLHRKYGASRFLTVKVPSKVKAPTYRQRLVEWATKEDKQFLGNTWTVFKMKQPKRSNNRLKTSDAPDKDEDCFEFLFFATSGPGLEPVPIEDLLQWSINIKHPKVLNMSFAKAYSRIDLNLTTTCPTLTFRRHEIREIEDHFADGTTEATCFDNDDKLWSRVNIYHPEAEAKDMEVMNDGCARMSYRAGQLVWEKLGFKGHPPSAFQGRLGGAKGMWMVDRNDNLGIWIELSSSQLKYPQHDQDDRHQMTLDVLDWTKPCAPSKIYRDFLPIIHAGGVPRRKFEAYINEALDFEDEELRTALGSPARLVKWLECRFSRPESNSEEQRWPGSSDPEKLRLMLESGFEPSVNLYAFACLSRSVQRLYDRHCVGLSLSSHFSTSLYGVADPVGCLMPGEIHICFTNQVEQPGQRPSATFDDLEALVGRNPAIRSSDIQKVRLVYKKELNHLVDVAVFPRKGMYPLAKKLQGGDYDGDHFILIWDPDLVEDFKNSPPPPLKSANGPDHFGVKQDRRTVKEVLDAGAGGVMSWLAQCMHLQMKEQLLGKVTNLHSRLAYLLRTLKGPALDAIADLHDYLVDTEKNGYTFESQDWNDFERRFLRHSISNDIRKKLFLGSFQQEYKRIEPKGRELSDLFKLLEDSRKLPADNLIDYLIFHVAGPRARLKYLSIMKEIEHQGPKATDDDLPKLFRELCSDYMGSAQKGSLVTSALQSLEISIKQDVLGPWRPHLVKDIEDADNKRTRFATMKSSCLAAYLSIQIPDAGGADPVLREWNRRSFGKFTAWDMIKLSCLYHCVENAGTKQKPLSLAFDIAGLDLCLFKALCHQKGTLTPLIPAVAVYRKMQRPPAPAEVAKELQDDAVSAFSEDSDSSVMNNVVYKDTDPEVLPDAPSDDDFHDALPHLMGRETQAYGGSLITSSAFELAFRPTQDT